MGDLRSPTTNVQTLITYDNKTIAQFIVTYWINVTDRNINTLEMDTVNSECTLIPFFCDSAASLNNRVVVRGFIVSDKTRIH